MKIPTTLINLDDTEYLVYPDYVTNINGMPVVKERWEKFICSNCKYFECEDFQVNGGKKLTGTATGCEKFILRDRNKA